MYGDLDKFTNNNVYNINIFSRKLVMLVFYVMLST